MIFRDGNSSHGWPFVPAVFSLLAITGMSPGCGENTPPASPDAAVVRDSAVGADRTMAADAPDPDPEPDPDAAPITPIDAGPPQTCLAIRNCVVRCQTDVACAQRCVDQAAAAARTIYQRVAMCSREACMATDMECRCEQECFGGGACLDLVDECGRSSAEDLFCDQLCM